MNVALCSRSQPDLEKAAQEIRDGTGRDAIAFAGDLDRPDTIRDLSPRPSSASGASISS